MYDGTFNSYAQRTPALPVHVIAGVELLLNRTGFYE